MGRDIFVQDLPLGITSVNQISDDFVPNVIGTRSQVITIIKRLFPSANFSDPAWGVLSEPSVFHIESNMGNNEILNYTLNAQIFRKLFGFEKVASSNFTMHKGLDRFQLDGQGLGHGVGLCQWGARAMAKDGARYRDILKSFYPKAKFHSPRRA